MAKVQMTLEEVVEKYGSTIGQWKRGWKKQADKVYQKTNGRVVIAKYKNDIYIVNESDVPRPRPIFEMPPERKRKISLECLSFLAFEQVVLLGVVFQDRYSFQGSYLEFLDVVAIEKRTENVERLKRAFEFLNEKQMLRYSVDKVPGYFGAVMEESVKQDIGITAERISECQKIALENNLIDYRGWNDVLKVWMAIEFLSQGYQGEEIYITNKMIEEVTDLDKKRVIQIKKALINSDKIIGDKGFRINKNGDIRCMGTTYKLNVIEEGNDKVESGVPQGTFDF